MLHTKIYLFLILAIAVVLGGNCKDYKLSAGDQSLVDMVKHYLHTSRKESCPKFNKDTVIRVTYTRWGRSRCPKGAELVYKGQVGGNHYNKRGGGTNYLCLPNNPDIGPAQSGNNQVYGGEYRSKKLTDYEIPCAVCTREQRATLLMIPGRKTCYRNWKMEYNGFLRTAHYTHYRNDYACVDMNPEILKNGSSAHDQGAFFYALNTKCGSLKCPPYKDNRDVYCVVCSK